jgi:hypothetical protein
MSGTSSAQDRARLEATGRRVIGFMSGIDIEQDLSCEVFTLEPTAAAGDDRRA